MFDALLVFNFYYQDPFTNTLMGDGRWQLVLGQEGQDARSWEFAARWPVVVDCR